MRPDDARGASAMATGAGKIPFGQWRAAWEKSRFTIPITHIIQMAGTACNTPIPAPAGCTHANRRATRNPARGRFWTR
jgi:hypothetical protein